MKTIDVKGTIVNNEDKWIYDWLDIQAVCPKDIQNALNEAAGDEVLLQINSGGGDIFAGSEIYYHISNYSGNTIADIVGFAGSAATVVACGAKLVRAAATAMYMIHNVSGGARGDYNVMDHNSQILKTANESIAAAYQNKTGMQKDEILNLMNQETWLSAEQAREKGFIDEILGEVKETPTEPLNALYNSIGVTILNEETKNKIRNEIKKPLDNDKKAFLNAKIELLKLEMR